MIPVLARFQARRQSRGQALADVRDRAAFPAAARRASATRFAAALWALDYLFVLAEHGCAGVNMETGVNHLGWISHYTPISDDLKGNYGAAPEYYGLKAFAQMPKGELVGVDCQTGGLNLTAYAVRNGRELGLAVINRDTQETDATIRLSGYKRGRVLRLTGPEPQAKDGVLLGGVTANGAWSGAKYEPVRVAHDRFALHLPAASAALVWLT